MIKRLAAIIGKEKVCILGFGAEGQSSFRLLQKIIPGSQIIIADKNPATISHPLLKDSEILVQTGEQYLQEIEKCALILKTPGIPFGELAHIPRKIISSQTEFFIRSYGRQIIGITGTKGKSTTASLIYHIIRQQTEDVILVGNMGIPPFDHIEEIGPDTLIVDELSSHQLEHIEVSPHTSLLLNLYEEHLDHYEGKEDYFRAKINIARYQQKEDTFIYNAEDAETARLMHQTPLAGTMIPVCSAVHEGLCCFPQHDTLIFQTDAGNQTRFSAHSGCALKGLHNRMNILFAIAACKTNGITDAAIEQGISSFKPLAHRMQYVGKFDGIDFYNDSIATIPEATIAAVKAIPNIATLILGGYDRGIDYHGLATFLAGTSISNLIFLGAAGKRMMEIIGQLQVKNIVLLEAASMEEAVRLAKKQTPPGKVCLLSPAAASYDTFKNFEERGAVFMQLAAS